MKIRNFIPITILLLVSFTSVYSQNKSEVTSKDVNTMIRKDPQWVVLDVRTPEEFASGHVKSAINIDVHQADAFERINKLDRNAKYIVYCRTKNRSGAVVNHMLRNGFKNIYQMTDGMVGWNLNSLPVVK